MKTSKRTSIVQGTIGYREFSQNLARPAFNNEVKYNLSESDIIAHKGARTEVIETADEYIKHKVIQNFNRAKDSSDL